MGGGGRGIERQIAGVYLQKPKPDEKSPRQLPEVRTISLLASIIDMSVDFSVQRWALSVFFNFFTNKKLFLAFCIKLI